MLCVLLLVLHWTLVSSSSSTRASSAALQEDGTRPFIHRCRSPNMEDFSCWWRPIEGQDNITYTLQYRTGDDAPQDCPDYTSSGTNSCFFDTRHTQVWQIYCMTVTAHTASGPRTSQRHCLDVADIVQTDPPFNLSYIMLNESHCESCRSVTLSWMFPIASLVREGWITLVYELRYRNLAQPDTWKVKERLREPHVDLLGLPVGKYEFMVRCRSGNSKHWSAWSESINISVIGKTLSDRLLVFILLTSLGIMAFLIIGFGFIPQGKRIKAFLLPPIPKPRIRGLEPVLLKNGKLDEINRHFSSFHGYKSPQYSIETWYQVSMDSGSALTPNSFPSHCEQKPVTGPEGPPALQTSSSPNPYCPSGPASYCEGATPPPDPGHALPELLSVPGMDYTMILGSAPAPASHDFYTCVTGVTASGQLHLVPHLPNMLKHTHTPYVQFKEDVDKSCQLVALLEKQKEELKDTDPSEAAMPLIPHSSD
ncbi:prolactin receptor-like [Rhinichthys klamathensis goyatoka]|uniref:prolactin receptor-like n=1 Tax=Rhinichthys klamathensis goyatoka TaxID=3034132 RepID=UPI0024B62D36|nr:prolactin receptor-like [Rhinichthys klamathensis goyatoka]